MTVGVGAVFLINYELKRRKRMEGLNAFLNDESFPGRSRS
jgi:hypothetical protein